ncbi:MAG TPA: serine hydrolase domain-containing protein [Candidatus Binatia bacterium]|nr:serine hydrolase domain-containing protein [Candidatus Binatia bacterium]
MENLRRVSALLVLAVVSWSAPYAAASPAERADAQLDAALAALITMPGGPPGAIAVVQRGRRLAVHAVGVVGFDTPRLPSETDHMRLASVSKAFNGAVALALVAQGRLSLDDTIATRLPSLPAAWGAVTLGQLLNHTSGIPNYLGVPAAQEAIGASPTVALPPSQLLDFVTDLPLEFAPGSTYRYSNSDNIAAGLMVEAATGTTYAEALTDEVYAPLGLEQTSLPEGAAMPAPFLRGYGFEPPAPPEDLSEVLAAGWPWAAGGVISTPADLNRFVRGYVSGALFRGPARRRQRTFIAGGNSDPPGPGSNDAGMSLFRYRTRCGTVFGHTGNFPGYTQFAAASRSGRRSTTVSITVQLRPDIDTAVFAALHEAWELAVCAAMARS